MEMMNLTSESVIVISFSCHTPIRVGVKDHCSKKTTQNTSSEKMTSGGEKLLSPLPLQKLTSTFLQCLEYTLMLDNVSAIFFRNKASSFLHLSLLAT